jgi:hypothetical protein
MESLPNLTAAREEDIEKLRLDVDKVLKESNFADMPYTLWHKNWFFDCLSTQVYFSFDKTIPASREADALTLKEKLTKLFQPHGKDVFEFRVRVGIGVGEAFPPSIGLKTLEDSDASFQVQPGMVYLINFWSTRWDLCRSLLHETNELMYKNKDKWAGKVKIVCISYDETAATANNEVTMQKWHNLEHYVAVGPRNSEAKKRYAITGFPTIMIVDQKGIIRLKDRADNIKLEQELTNLLEQGADAYNPTEEAYSKRLPLKEERDICAKLVEEVKLSKDLMKKVLDLGCTLSFRTNFENGHFVRYRGYCSLSGILTSEDISCLKKYVEKQVALLPNDFKVKLEFRQVVNAPVNYGTQCIHCQIALGKEVPHYICTACTRAGQLDQTYCTRCINDEYTRDIRSGDELIHKHPLLYVNGDMQESLLNLHRMFNKSKVIGPDHELYQEVLETKAVPGMECDLCRQPEKQYRFVCATCFSLDSCLDCFNLSRDPSNKGYQALMARCLEKGHDPITHPMYRAHYFLDIKQDPAAPLELGGVISALTAK